MIRVLLFIAVCVSYAYGESVVCEGLPDGTVPEFGCRSFSRCEGGKRVIVECHPDVYNEKLQTCDKIGNVAPPCGLTQDCTGTKDGRYAEYAEDCKSYYTCYGHNYYGHNPCPGVLVFDPDMQICNHVYDVAPPCGTKGAR